MKQNRIVFLCISLLGFLFSQESFAQPATSFFPTTQNFRWDYVYTPLDTNGNPIQTPIIPRSTSFFVGSNTVGGRNAQAVTSVNNFSEFGDSLFLPSFEDTSYYSLTGDSAGLYLNPLSIIGEFGDSAEAAQIDSLAGFLNSFTGWYFLYRFNATQNTDYVVIRRDTTVTIDSTAVPLRFEVTGRRLANDSLTTPFGKFDTRKFVVTYTLGYRLQIFSTTTIFPLVQFRDSTWIAQNRWIVRQYLPPSRIPAVENIPIEIEGLPTIAIPGRILDLAEEPLSIQKVEKNVREPRGFELSQNYPNPFNPSTTIRFQLPFSSNTRLEVYDILGRKLSTLVNGYLQRGAYQIAFDASGLASGFYFYRIEATAGSSSFSATKKMMLIK
ncbi:MAG: T9SS type A sorting domain-containing protein [Chloroherpetonaceae bacterium]|nr:T9SS type A sorting domain-containing protein [Chloroherpetonaceae bacterium]